MPTTRIEMIDVTGGVPGVNAPAPTTYEEFWPYYVSQHLTR